MKYNIQDIKTMIDCFSNISNHRQEHEYIMSELIKISKYPTYVLQEFIHCMELFSEKDDNYIKDNYNGIIAYITLRLNFIK